MSTPATSRPTMYAEGIDPMRYARATITTAVPTAPIRVPSVAEHSPGSRPTRKNLALPGRTPSGHGLVGAEVELVGDLVDAPQRSGFDDLVDAVVADGFLRCDALHGGGELVPPEGPETDREELPVLPEAPGPARASPPARGTRTLCPDTRRRRSPRMSCPASGGAPARRRTFGKRARLGAARGGADGR